MARGPAVVIVARHGARLDAADKAWHLTSPTPYDPPLTYGGWSQGKALGLRIAALLHQRETERAEEATNGPNDDLAHLDFSPLDGSNTAKNGHNKGIAKRRRGHKIVIHSSPFLRCIQTSTAIAAGISQYQPPAPAGADATKLKVPEPAKETSGLLGTSPLTKSSRSDSVAVLGPAADPNLEVFPLPHVGPEKILLRIDAFLGEWLSTDYFEDITPPPNSTMMVASAKADLLRKCDYVETQPTTHSSKGHFPGGWVKSATTSAANSRKPSEDSSFPTMGSLAQLSPFRERSSSQGGGPLQRSRSRENGLASLSTAHKVPSNIYDPPIPSYAVSTSDPIPRGYVSHARDACISVDFQWDSMRAPQEWGDGGEYGDSWSTMHKRFRKGLAGMVDWYREHGSMPPNDQFPGFTFRERAAATLHHASDPGPKPDVDTEDDEELVLVLVTHGAGCNALLGAITHQPVLIDVGLAALSMAVLRDEPRRPSAASFYEPPSSVPDPGMSDTYELKLLASLDHLRPGVDPSNLPQPQSPAVTASPSLEYRRRFAGSGGTNSPSNLIDSPFALEEPVRFGWNSSLGSMRRSSTSGSSSRLLSNHPGSTSASPMMTTGLWSSNLRIPSFDNSSSDGRRSPGADMVANLREFQPPPKPTPSSTFSSTTTTTSIPNTDGTSITANSNAHEDKEEGDDVAPLKVKWGYHVKNSLGAGSQGLWAPKPTSAPNGLWGPPRLEGVLEHDPGPKRRWTISERE